MVGTSARANHSTGPPANQPRLNQRVRWRMVIIYVALAYGIAWVFWIPVMSEAMHALATWRTPDTYRGGRYAAFGMFAPAVAAIIMRLFISKEGLKGSLGPVRRWRYYLVALFLPIALVATTIGVSVAAGLSEFNPGTDKPLWYVLLLLLLVGTPVSSVLALGEEYGWRGYLLPKLLPLGEVKASIILALIWAPWHLPLLLAGLNYLGKDPLAVLVFMTVLGIGLSLLFTRVFVASGGSVLVVALMHGSLNAFGDRLADSAHLPGDPFVVSLGGLIGFGVIAVAVLIAYSRRRPTVSEAPQPVIDPERSRRRPSSR
jgi:CAAX protease family protein